MLRRVISLASTFVMPTLPEQIASATAKLDALLPVAPSGDEAKLLTAAEIFEQLSKERKGTVSKERAAYHAEVLTALAKNNYEATEFRSLPVLNDPMRTNPETASIGTVQSVTTGTPDSLFSTNLRAAMSVAQKAALIQKVLTNPDKIQKGAFSDKLDDIVEMFGFSKDDMNQECELRWKISDLVYQLQAAAKLERLVEKAGTAEKTVTEPAKTPEAQPGVGGDVWPLDMAGADFDAVAKSYKKPELAWGRDRETPSGS